MHPFHRKNSALAASILATEARCERAHFAPLFRVVGFLNFTDTFVGIRFSNYHHSL